MAALDAVHFDTNGVIDSRAAAQSDWARHFALQLTRDVGHHLTLLYLVYTVRSTGATGHAGMTILSGLDGMVLEICLVLGDNR